MHSPIVEVFRVALPLMISTGLFSLTLFVDRTMLLWYDGTSMSASMAAGNLFWVIICLPVGIASMTGAIVSQYVGSHQYDRVGRFLWQSVWMAIAFVPWFAGVAYFAPDLFEATGQQASLIDAESTYLRWLLLGATGCVLESALSGFFSGTERTGIILMTSIAAALLNVVADYVLIFGVEWWGQTWIPRLGIAGAAIASTLSFWLKAVVFASLLWFRRDYFDRYQIRTGFGFDPKPLKKLIYFGLPAGLMLATESGAFTFIVLRIGTLGDVPLRATSMAINFNMIAFIPLMGVSIAASVLVGRHLTESGPVEANRRARAALVVGWIYSGLWALAYWFGADLMLSFYGWDNTDPKSDEAIKIGAELMFYVALYVIADATQVVLAGILRGAGDTWFVLLSGLSAGGVALAVGWFGESWAARSLDASLNWWWQVMVMWIWLLCGLMVTRYLQGRWKSMRMVDAPHVH
jgi:multidrug resistance protein, MATE family